MSDLSDPTNAGFNKKKPKTQKEKPPADISELFAAEDRRIAIWGRPYTGPVKNTKIQETSEHLR